MTRLNTLLRVNPIIVKELRSRMRGPRAFITLTITLLVTGGLMFGMLQLMLAISSYSTELLSPRIGQGLFSALAFLELVMICAITPAVTSGAISGEKEKLTYEMLQATPLSPASVLWGKLVSALSYIILLVLAGIPLASLVFIFGGVAPLDMLKALLVLVILAVSFGVMGLFMSALFGRTGRATVASFVVVMALTFIPLLAAVAVGILRQGEPPRWILAPSPVSMLASVMAGSVSSGNPLGQLIPLLGGWWMQTAITPISQTSIPRPLYHYGFPLYAGISLVLYLLTTRLLQPSRRWRLTRKEILVAAVLLLGFAGAVAAIFLGTASRYEWVRANAAPSVTGPAAQTVVALPVMKGGVMMGAGAGGTPTPISTVAARPDVVPEMYAAVARQIYTVDNNLGEKPLKYPHIYLINVSDDRAGDPALPDGKSAPIPPDLQKTVADQLTADLSATVQWVGSANELPKDETGGVVVTFGNAYLRDNGSLILAASLDIPPQTGGGRTYVLEKQPDGKWAVTGTTGLLWIK